MARLPSLINLDTFITKCTNNKADQLVISKADSIKLVNDYKRLLTYIAELQALVIEERAENEVTVEIKSPDF